MDSQDFGKFISILRKERELSQSQLAALLMVSPKTISRWETGKGYPDIETIPRLSEALGVSLEELFRMKKDPAAPETAEENLTEETVVEKVQNIYAQWEEEWALKRLEDKERRRKRHVPLLILGSLIALYLLLLLIPLPRHYDKTLHGLYGSGTGQPQPVTVTLDVTAYHHVRLPFLGVLDPSQKDTVKGSIDVYTSAGGNETELLTAVHSANAWDPWAFKWQLQHEPLAVDGEVWRSVKLTYVYTQRTQGITGEFRFTEDFSKIALLPDTGEPLLLVAVDDGDYNLNKIFNKQAAFR